MLNKEFKLYVACEHIEDESGVSKPIYFISTAGLVSQVFKGLSDEENSKLSLITPLSAFEELTGKDEVTLLSELIKCIGSSSHQLDYINSDNKKGMVLTFSDKNSAAMLIKLLVENAPKKYSILFR